MIETKAQYLLHFRKILIFHIFPAVLQIFDWIKVGFS